MNNNMGMQKNKILFFFLGLVVAYKADAQFTGGGGAGAASGAISSQPLPVTWISFTATPSDQCIVLNWVTASEVNNSGFRIERSVDLKSWSSITFVTGNGTSVMSHSYSFSDRDVKENVQYYYRLVQVDFDGTSYLSFVESAKLNNLLSNSVVTLYPNPATDFLKVNFLVDVSKVNLEIYDVSGNLKWMGEAEGNYAEVPLSQLPSGVYTISFLINGKKVSQQFVHKLN